MAHLSGIYEIRNVVNGHCYVGSALDIQRRWWNHVSELQRRVHPNRHLRSAWSRYGQANFLFTVIEFCDPDALIVREQFYIDTIRPAYNMRPMAGSSKGAKVSEKTKELLRQINTGKTLSDETKRKIGDALRGKRISDAQKKLISATLMGHSFSDEARRRMSDAQKARFANTPITEAFRQSRRNAANARWTKVGAQ